MVSVDIQIKGLPQDATAYLVGGSVRDVILGHTPTDYDIAVAGNVATYAHKVSQSTGGKLVVLGKAHQKVFRIILNDRVLDISALNGSTIGDDLKNRDFTINALAIDIRAGQIIDHLGGLDDLHAKKVKIVSEHAFKNDPIRMLRAFRIATEFNFEITMPTLNAICASAHLIHRSAGERIRTELLKMLCCLDAYPYLCQMAQTRLLPALLFDFDLRQELSEFLQQYGKNMFRHALATIRHLEQTATALNDRLLKIRNFPEITIPNQHLSLLKLTALLTAVLPSPAFEHQLPTHDYCNDAQAPGKQLTLMANRLRLSNKERKLITIIIQNRSKPRYLFNLSPKSLYVDLTLIHFYLDCHQFAALVMLYALADQEAVVNSANNNRHHFSQFIQELLNHYHHVYLARLKKPPLIEGDDLIKFFGLTPSPLFKTILSRIEELRLAGQLKNREQALQVLPGIISELRQAGTM